MQSQGTCSPGLARHAPCSAASLPSGRGEREQDAVAPRLVSGGMDEPLPVLGVKGQERSGLLVAVEPVVDALKEQLHPVGPAAHGAHGLRRAPLERAAIELRKRAARGPLADDEVAACRVVDEVVHGHVKARQRVHARQGVHRVALGLPHHAPLAVHRLAAGGVHAVDLERDERQRGRAEPLAHVRHERGKARGIRIAAAFKALRLALIPEHGPRAQPVRVQQLEHVVQQRAVFIRVPPAQRRAAVGGHHKADGVAELALQNLCKMQPGRMARVVVLIMAGIDRARRLPERVGGEVPAAAVAQQVHAQLRRVVHRVLGAARGVALPRDDEHIPHADIVHHVPARAGEAVPAFVLHVRLDAVEPARRYGGELDLPCAAVEHAAIRPRDHAVAAALTRDARLDRHAALLHIGKRQRQLLAEPHAAVPPGQADGRRTAAVLLKDLPRRSAAGDRYAKVCCLFPHAALLSRALLRAPLSYHIAAPRSIPEKRVRRAQTEGAPPHAGRGAGGGAAAPQSVSPLRRRCRARRQRPR